MASRGLGFALSALNEFLRLAPELSTGWLQQVIPGIFLPRNCHNLTRISLAPLSVWLQRAQQAEPTGRAEACGDPSMDPYSENFNLPFASFLEEERRLEVQAAAVSVADPERLGDVPKYLCRHSPSPVLSQLHPNLSQLNPNLSQLNPNLS
jgi:hypothetical protein